MISQGAGNVEIQLRPARQAGPQRRQGRQPGLQRQPVGVRRRVPAGADAVRPQGQVHVQARRPQAEQIRRSRRARVEQRAARPRQALQPDLPRQGLAVPAVGAVEHQIQAQVLQPLPGIQARPQFALQVEQRRPQARGQPGIRTQLPHGPLRADRPQAVRPRRFRTDVERHAGVARQAQIGLRRAQGEGLVGPDVGLGLQFQAFAPSAGLQVQGLQGPGQAQLQIDPAVRPGRFAAGFPAAGSQQPPQADRRLRAAVLGGPVQIELEGPGRRQPAQGQVAVELQQRVPMRGLQVIQRHGGRMGIQRQGGRYGQQIDGQRLPVDAQAQAPQRQPVHPQAQRQRRHPERFIGGGLGGGRRGAQGHVHAHGRQVVDVQAAVQQFRPERLEVQSGHAHIHVGQGDRQAFDVQPPGQGAAHAMGLAAQLDGRRAQQPAGARGAGDAPGGEAHGQQQRQHDGRQPPESEGPQAAPDTPPQNAIPRENCSRRRRSFCAQARSTKNGPAGVRTARPAP